MSPLRAQNVRDYVAAGGKWYATDHANEYIEEPFSDYQEFHSPGMPDIQPAYDVGGEVVVVVRDELGGVDWQVLPLRAQ